MKSTLQLIALDPKGGGAGLKASGQASIQRRCRRQGGALSRPRNDERGRSGGSPFGPSRRNVMRGHL